MWYENGTNQAPAAALHSPGEDGRQCCCCDGTDFELLHHWESHHPRNSATIPLGMWKCRCGMAILHPVPTTEQLPGEGDWWCPKRRFMPRRYNFKVWRTRFEGWLFGTPRQRFIRQTRRLVADGKLLDVGCGKGELLQCAQAHYECVGLEPSKQAVQLARARGFRVFRATLESARVKAGTIDVVTMDAVLEHLVDPLAALQSVAAWLKPGGVVAIKVPKLWGPSHRRHGREWNGFRVGYHTAMFTGATLEAVLRRAGLEPVAHPRRDRPLDDILAMWARKGASVAETHTASRDAA